ncbi:hypothetical protein D3C80_1969380 [compost metagenome]
MGSDVPQVTSMTSVGLEFSYFSISAVTPIRASARSIRSSPAAKGTTGFCKFMGSAPRLALTSTGMANWLRLVALSKIM